MPLLDSVTHHWLQDCKWSWSSLRCFLLYVPSCLRLFNCNLSVYNLFFTCVIFGVSTLIPFFCFSQRYCHSGWRLACFSAFPLPYSKFSLLSLMSKPVYQNWMWGSYMCWLFSYSGRHISWFPCSFLGIRIFQTVLAHSFDFML